MVLSKLLSKDVADIPSLLTTKSTTPFAECRHVKALVETVEAFRERSLDKFDKVRKEYKKGVVLLFLLFYFTLLCFFCFCFCFCFSFSFSFLFLVVIFSFSFFLFSEIDDDEVISERFADLSESILEQVCVFPCSFTFSFVHRTYYVSLSLTLA
jgi:hypothetical protein